DRPDIAYSHVFSPPLDVSQDHDRHRLQAQAMPYVTYFRAANGNHGPPFRVGAHGRPFLRSRSGGRQAQNAVTALGSPTNWSTQRTRSPSSAKKSICVSSNERPSGRVPLLRVRTATWPSPSAMIDSGTGRSVPPVSCIDSARKATIPSLP